MLFTVNFFQERSERSTWEGFRQALWLLAMSPAMDNTLSAATEVAGIHKIFLAKVANNASRDSVPIN